MITLEKIKSLSTKNKKLIKEYGILKARRGQLVSDLSAEFEAAGMSSELAKKKANSDQRVIEIDNKIKPLVAEQRRIQESYDYSRAEYIRSRIMIPIVDHFNPKVDPAFVRNGKSVDVSPFHHDREIFADIACEMIDSIMGGFVCENKIDGTCTNLTYMGDGKTVLYDGHKAVSKYSLTQKAYLNPFCWNLAHCLAPIFRDRQMMIHGELAGPGISDNIHKLKALEFLVWDISDSEGSYLPSIRPWRRIKGSTVESIKNRCFTSTVKCTVASFDSELISLASIEKNDVGLSHYRKAVLISEADLILSEIEIEKIKSQSLFTKKRILLEKGFAIFSVAESQVGEFKLRRAPVLEYNTSTKEWQEWSGRTEFGLDVPDPDCRLINKSIDIYLTFDHCNPTTSLCSEGKEGSEGLVMKPPIMVRIGPDPGSKFSNLVRYKVRHDTLLDAIVAQLKEHPELIDLKVRLTDEDLGIDHSTMEA